MNVFSFLDRIFINRYSAFQEFRDLVIFWIWFHSSYFEKYYCANLFHSRYIIFICKNNKI